MYERRRGRELGSALLLADAAHTASDILVTLLAIASLVLVAARATCAPTRARRCVVALIIAWSGFQILRAVDPGPGG